MTNLRRDAIFRHRSVANGLWLPHAVKRRLGVSGVSHADQLRAASGRDPDVRLRARSSRSRSSGLGAAIGDPT